MITLKSLSVNCYSLKLGDKLKFKRGYSVCFDLWFSFDFLGK